MHILILPSWYPKSPADVFGVFFRDQALALSNYGHKVGVIAPEMRSLRNLFSSELKSNRIHYEFDAGVDTYRRAFFAALPRIPFGNYVLFKCVAKKLLKTYIDERGKPDIIHAHCAIYAGAAAVEIAKDFDIPVVLTEHSTGYARGLYARWQLKMAEKAFKQSRISIAVSPDLGKLLSDLLPSAQNIWKWIPNVVAERFKAPESFEPELRAIRFVNLALMTEKKGQFDLVKAFKLLVDKDIHAELWLAGDGPIKEALRREVHDLGIVEKVKFLGLIQPDSVPNLLEQVDVMVVSSHYETFGVVAAEALMAGLPVIATRCGGPECIISDSDGLLVPVKHPEALSKAMQNIALNLNFYDRKAIASNAKARFSGAAVAVQLTHEYERIVSETADQAMPR